ncbi:MAG TPA: MATE family efflux transporter [Ruminiclostridium sp.]
MIVVNEANITKSIFKIAIPTVIEQMLIMIVGVVSLAFVGRLNNEAVTAVGFINSLFGFIQVFFVALSTGCTVVIARLIGEGNVNMAKSAIKQCVVIGFAISSVFAVCLILFARPVIVAFFGGAEQIVIDMATKYFKITLITLPLMFANIIISGSLRGAGDTKTPMLIANIVNILNIVLCYVLIYGISIGDFSIAKMGVTGAAIAVCISRGVGGLLSLFVVLNKTVLLSFSLKGRLLIDFPLLKRILHVGIPASLEQLIMQGGFLLLQVVISRMGTESSTVYQIVMSINSICFVPIFGFGISATTMVGQSLGAKRIDLAKKSGWQTIKICLCITVVLSSLLFIFAGNLIRIYTNDITIISIGVGAIRLFSFSQPFVSIVTVVSNALRGAGDMAYVMLTSFIGIWCLRLLVTFGLDYLFKIGINAAWIALFLDFFIRAMMYLVRFRKGKWTNITI